MSRSSTITAKKVRKADLLHNPHAGEVLLEEFMKPMGITQNALARAIGVPPRRINEIVHGRRAVPRTPTCGSPATSACPKAYSSVCRPTSS